MSSDNSEPPRNNLQLGLTCLAYTQFERTLRRNPMPSLTSVSTVNGITTERIALASEVS